MSRFGLLDLALHAAHLGVEVDVVGAGCWREVGELFLEFDDRFFKFERLDTSSAGKVIRG